MIHGMAFSKYHVTEFMVKNNHINVTSVQSLQIYVQERINSHNNPKTKQTSNLVTNEYESKETKGGVRPPHNLSVEAFHIS